MISSIFSRFRWFRDAGISLVVCVLLLMSGWGALAFAQVPGSIAGQFSVTESGAASYSIALSIPPGTVGMAPNLTLNYNSSAPSGFMGPGWNLGGLSSITRCGATSAVDGFIGGISLATTDKYCLDGQRLIAVSGSYGSDGTEYRTQIESFARVVSHGASGNGPTYFTVELRNGLRLELGATPDSKLRNLSASVLTWNVNKVSDRSGNFYSVSYLQDLTQGSLVPRSIDYTGNPVANISPYNQVTFEYEPRSFPKSAYVGGELFATTQRLKKISADAEGLPAMSYTLNYDLDTALSEDRLVSIQQCATPANCLPPTNFQWGSAGGGTFSSPAGLADFSPAQGYGDESTRSILSGDWNADGRTDIARIFTGGLHFYRMDGPGVGFTLMPDLNDFGIGAGYSNTDAYPIVTGDWNGDGTTDVARVFNGGIHFKAISQAGYTVLTDISDLGINQGYSSNSQYPLFVGDWNGDGRSDIARVRDSGIRFYNSNGTSFTFVFELPNLGPSAGYWNGYIYPLFTGDWNGDGRTDIGRVWDGGIHLYVSTGNGFSQLPDLQALGRNQGYWNTGTYPLIVGDWNGDGLSDIARVWDGGIHFYISTGSSFILSSHMPGVGPSDGFTDSDTYPILTGDWNGDGRTDIARVASSNLRYFVSRPNGFEPFAVLSDFSPAQGYTNDNQRPFVEGDWNGDGLADVGRVGASAVQFSVRAPSNSDKVIRIIDGLGKRIEIDFASLTDGSVYAKNSSAQYPQIDIQQASEVVAAVRTSNGLGGEATQLFHYSGLVFDFSRRDLKGFAAINIFDAVTNITTRTDYHQGFPLEGRAYQVERRLQDSTLIERTLSTWTSITPSAGTALPLASQTIEEEFELDGTPVQHSLTARTFDGFGNPTQTAITRSDGSSETTVSTFNNDTTQWLIGQISQLSVTSQGGGVGAPPAIIRTTNFTYESTRGLLLQEVIEPQSSTHRVAKNYTYDLFGNILTTTLSGSNFATRIYTASYDQRGRFAVQTANPLGHIEQKSYDSRTGAITRSVDVNGLVTDRTYDGFSRPLTEIRPDGTQTQTSYLFPDTNAPSDTAFSVRTLTTGSPSLTTCFDILGRETHSRLDRFDGRQVFVDRTYDERGNLTLLSDPYFPGDTVYWTSTEYDLLSRSIRSTAPGNQQTVFAHNGLTTTTTNPLGQTRTEVFDTQGRTVQVTDNLGNVLHIARDSLGNPLQIVDHVGNVTSFSYDLGGRKLSMNDPDTGFSSYAYNGLGELLASTNANNQTTNYSYDLLGRMVSRSSPDGVEGWVYDTAVNGIGRLASISGLHGFQEQYGYDSLGRVVQTFTMIGANQFVVAQTYDTAGRINTITYPSGYTVRHIYDGGGSLKAVQQVSTSKILWKAGARNSRGQLESQAYGNGQTTLLQYDPLTGYLQRIKTGSIQDLGFQFDALGTLIQRTDNTRGLRETFGYDGLNRLITSQVSGMQPVSVTYDVIGNIISRSDRGVYSYPSPGSPHPHAVTSVIGSSTLNYSYDAVGNRLTSSTGTIQYGASGKPIRISEGLSSIQFDFDPSDSRIEERNYRGTTLRERKQYVAGGLFERVESGGVTSLVHYIKGSEGLVAQMTTRVVTKPGSGTVSTDTLRYLHLDHLGSIQSITDEAGALIEVQSYDSWGRRRDPITWDAVPYSVKSLIDRGFTGHEQLDSVGLIHMNGRVYDPLIGRFVTPDPLVQSPTDMQSYNRYSYVLNNPLSLTDPTGHLSFRSLRKLVMRTARMLIRQAVTSAATAIGNQLGGPILAAYMGNFTNSLVNGNGMSRSYHAGFRHLLQNSIHAHLDTVIGHGIDGSGGFSKYGPLALASAHAVADAGYAAATGGNARSAFLSGFGGSLGASVGTQLGSPMFGADPAGYIGASLGGGTAAALGGGKFHDGAMRGAFIYLYNHSGPDGYICDARGACKLHITIRPVNMGAGASSSVGQTGFFGQIGAWLSEHGDTFGAASNILESTARGFEENWASNRVSNLFTPLITAPLYGMAAMSESLAIVARPPNSADDLFNRVVRMNDLRRKAMEGSSGVSRLEEWHNWLNK